MSEVTLENEKQKTPAQRTKAIFERDDIKQKLQEMLGKKAPGFITSVLSSIQANDMLKNADPNSVYMSAMMAASLDLPINSNLGLAYLIPYNIRQQDGSFKQVAQFQIGYKGFIQLALRSGQFKTISAAPIFTGQIVGEDPLKGYEFDWNKKEDETVIGYASYFQLLNGFEKTLYMTNAQLEAHGGKYSKTFKHKRGLWNTDFESMARKTVLKLLLQRYAPLSIEMQKATISDQAVINDWETMDVDYQDNPTQDVEHTELSQLEILINRIGQMLEACENQEDIDKLIDGIPDGIPDQLEEQYQAKLKEIQDQEK